MFDISFSELLVIAVVALLVIGPEKLPKLARTAGAFAGRVQRFVAQVKDEVNREARFEELQRLQQEVKAGVMQVEHSIMQGAQSLAVTENITALNEQLQELAEETMPAEKIKDTVVAQTEVNNTKRTKKASSPNSDVLTPKRTKVRKALTDQQSLNLDLQAPDLISETDQSALNKRVKRTAKPKSELN